MDYANCQSCGMPLKKDPRGGGTEANGERNPMYCSHCYDKGTFTQPEITVARMQGQVRGKLKGMGIPGFLGYFFVKKIPKLERWRNL